VSDGATVLAAIELTPLVAPGIDGQRVPRAHNPN
jgi:hypothetical protein